MSTPSSTSDGHGDDVGPLPAEEKAPSTPPNPPTKIKLTLPTPPSFSAHRRAQCITSSPSESPQRETPKKKGHNRSVSFNHDVEIKTLSPDGKPLYRIPHRVAPLDYSGSLIDETVSPRTRKGPPSALQLGATRSPRAGQLPLRSPFNPLKAGPKTAPVQSRFATTAAARGLTIEPALAKMKEKRSSTQGLPGSNSIWSAGLTASGGWITPGLSSAKSTTSISAKGTTTTVRQRGLSVAVLKDGKEMLVDSGPITPGLPSARRKSIEAVKDNDKPDVSAEKDRASQAPKTPGSAKPKEGRVPCSPMKIIAHVAVILCRYFHTPGLTCTSRPCRFVHSLSTLPPSPSVDPSKLRMLSPTRSPDYTMGTFSQAQDEKLNPQGKDIDALVSQAQPGETVVLAAESGAEMVGTVYYMSGGGKGPAGKSKAKYKTVKCRDFSEGYCAYGDSCSFIHEEKPKPTKKDVKDEKPIEKEDKDEKPTDKENKDEKPTDTEDKGKKPKSKSAWSRGPPKFPARKDGLSAFAAPYSTTALAVAPSGEVKQADEVPLPQLPAKPTKKSAWTKGPPIFVKTVRVPSPDEAQPIPTPSHAHLIPPSSAWTASSSTTEEMAPVPAAAYPWGMPMSPLQPHHQAQGDFQVGPGVLWTPSGWAVQDAAMKWAMMGVEQLQRQASGTAPPKPRKGMKNYYRKRPCKFFAQGHCPHGDACTYLHVLPTAHANGASSDSDTPAPAAVKPTLPCKFLNSQSGCQNGDSCTFLHTFLAKCHLGEACHFAHVVDPHFPLPRGYQRTLNTTGQMCYEGVCARGESCIFVHYRPPVHGEEDHSMTEGRVEALRQLVKAAGQSDEESEDEDEDDDEIQIVTADTSISA